MSNNKEREALMEMVDDYAEASFDQGLHQRTEDDAPEEARAKLETALRDALAGRASLAASAGSEPVALDHIACIEGGELRYMTGRKAPAYDCELYAMPDGKNAPPLYTHPSPPEGAPDPQLLKFYGVTTAAALIEAQARHIERLQSKSQQTPSFAPRRAREG